MIGYGNSMFLSTHGILARSASAPTFSFLLDTYSGAAVAYSLRKLRTAYTGAAIRVRRSRDNAEQDINFVGNDLDTQSLLDFVGYNLWSYSEEFNNTVWVKSNLNTTGTPSYINVETAPDSTLTGDKVIENTVSDLHGFFRISPTLVIGTTYNLSVYLKQGERKKVRILSSAAAANQRCDIDLTNGAISNNTFANTPIVTTEANGWYRFSISITATVTTTTDFFTLRLFNASNIISYTGDGTSGAYVWGFQLTQSSSVLPYGKTLADASSNGFVTTWYDQSGANNATQATAAIQAQIVSSGAVITDPNTGKISATWTSDSYILSSNVAVTQNMLVSGVINRTATVTSQWLLGHNATIPRLVGTSNSGDIISQVVTGSITHGNITTGAFILSGLRDSSNIVKAWTNTTALTTGTSTGVSGNFSRFGFQNTAGSTGRMVEMIYWDNDKESSRADIVTNQNTYWEVY